MVDGILLILAALCAVYFVIIVIYGESALLLPLYGCFLRLFAYFLFMENGITAVICLTFPSGCL